MSSSATSYGDNPRIKVISNAINRTADIPNFSQSANEIRGMNTIENSGFLRLTAQTSANSCIDLIGANEHPNGIKYNNSVRIATGGVERMIIDGSGNVGVGANALVAGIRLDIAGGAARVNSGATTSTALTTTGRVGINNAAPTVPLDVAGAASITGGLNMNSSLITNLLTPTANDHAANKGYVDTATAAAAAVGSAAQTTANTAVTNAATAQTTANSAKSTADALVVATTSGTATASALYLYPANGQPAGILTNGAWRLYVEPGGNIGIGTTVPLCPLHVNGSAQVMTGDSTYLYREGIASRVAAANRATTALFEGGWIAYSAGVIQYSDKRIKTDIINIDSTTNIEIFRKIIPVTHGYIDKLEYGNLNKYGFIAQEIQKLLPGAVVPKTQVIPSIYNKAAIINTQNKFLLSFNKPIQDIQQFKIGIKLKCYDIKNAIVWVTIKDIIDTQNIEIEEEIKNDELFVYGHSVDDFLQIEKDAIFTVATAALQEVDRQQQADKARIAELEATVATQQSLINDILERLKSKGM
jgi:hypothetical protein